MHFSRFWNISNQSLLWLISELVVLVHSFEQLLLKNVLENMNRETMNGKMTSKPGRKRRGWIVLHIKCLSVYFISLSRVFVLPLRRFFTLCFMNSSSIASKTLADRINPIDANCVRVKTLAESNEASDLKKRKWERNSRRKREWESQKVRDSAERWCWNKPKDFKAKYHLLFHWLTL